VVPANIASITRWTLSEISDRSGTPCICHGVSRFYITAGALIYVTLQILQLSVRRMRGRVSHRYFVSSRLSALSSAQKSRDWPLLKLKFDNMMSAACCTISSRSSPASCGCITSFWRFFECNPMLICRNATRQFVIPLRYSPTSCFANLRSPSMRLRRKR